MERWPLATLCDWVDGALVVGSAARRRGLTDAASCFWRSARALSLSWDHRQMWSWSVAIALPFAAVRVNYFGGPRPPAGLPGALVFNTSRARRILEASKDFDHLAVREMYIHAMRGYVKHGFPKDEVRPLSCRPRRRNEIDPEEFVMGNYMLTLVDALDSMVIFGEHDIFAGAVRSISARLSFDRNITVSTFEACIRVMGGLLSGHILATAQDWLLPEYDGKLLALADDLGRRLLRAFATETGLPFPRVNLRHGLQDLVLVPEAEHRPGGRGASTIAECSSMLLEFAALSYLTGDDRFLTAARNASMTVWRNRDRFDLVPSGVNTATGRPLGKLAGVGPGSDSFFEYLAKGSIILRDRELAEVFLRAFAAVEKHAMKEHLPVWSDTSTRQLLTNFHSLSAFWPQLQVGSADKPPQAAPAHFVEDSCGTLRMGPADLHTERPGVVPVSDTPRRS
eukprot:Polyplicarium_translucidae@DN2652_c0_g1_i10.p1